MTAGAVVRKIAVAAASGGFVFLVTEFAIILPATQSLTLSIVIGSVVMLVQLLVDFDARIEGIERWMRATDVAIESSKWQQALDDSALDRVTRFREAIVNFGLDRPPLIRRFAETVVKGDTDLFDRLSRGEGTGDSEDHNWVLQLTSTTMKSLDATSTTTANGKGENFSGGFWTTEHGRRYLEAQVEAMGRGVVIRRLFIMQDAKDINESPLATRRMIRYDPSWSAPTWGCHSRRPC
jgi:hypothetical protein